MTRADGEGPAAADDRALAIAADVRAGRRRAADVLAACRARHEASRARLNALVQPRFDAAAAEAHAVDDARRGPLAGVPVSVKECFPVRGLTTTLGIRSRAGAADEADAALVSRLREAGAVIVGKANVPQAMYLHETDNPVHGRTNHPHHPGRGPGGSSGGDAALVAAGVVPLALGTDLAGSLRQPAHACGVAAIVPRTCVVGEGGAFDTLPHLRAVRPRAGFLARAVADLALACRATIGDVPCRSAALRRVGWWDATGPIPPSPAIRRGLAEAVARLAAAGVETVRLPGGLADQAAWLHVAILSADGGADIRLLFAGERPMPGVARLLRLAGMPRWLRPAVAVGARLAGRGIEATGLAATGPRDAAGLAALGAARRALEERLVRAVEGCDALVCPTSAVPALRHGTAARLVLAAAPCFLANLLDLPAGVVPVTAVRPDEEFGRRPARDPVLRAAAAADRGSRGLPVGVQVIAPPGGDEAAVLEAMRVIERPVGPGLSRAGG